MGPRPRSLTNRTEARAKSCRVVRYRVACRARCDLAASGAVTPGRAGCRLVARSSVGTWRCRFAASTATRGESVGPTVGVGSSPASTMAGAEEGALDSELHPAAQSGRSAPTDAYNLRRERMSQRGWSSGGWRQSSAADCPNRAVKEPDETSLPGSLWPANRRTREPEPRSRPARQNSESGPLDPARSHTRAPTTPPTATTDSTPNRSTRMVGGF